MSYMEEKSTYTYIKILLQTYGYMFVFYICGGEGKDDDEEYYYDEEEKKRMEKDEE